MMMSKVCTRGDMATASFLVLLQLVLFLQTLEDVHGASFVSRSSSSCSSVERTSSSDGVKIHELARSNNLNVQYDEGSCLHHRPHRRAASVRTNMMNEYDDFDDFGGGYIGGGGGGGSDDSNNSVFSKLLLEQRSNDMTACQTRQFSLGSDVQLIDFVGNLGFDEVTDWEYYYPSEDPRDDDRKVVPPNPFDPENQPRRTRTRSGGVVRVFRGEFVGMLGGMLRAQGSDNRILVKEYSGRFPLELARAEIQTLSKLQSQLYNDNTEKNGKNDEEESWISIASGRGNDDDTIGRTRKDNSNVAQILKWLNAKGNGSNKNNSNGNNRFVGLLGQIDLDEIERFDTNGFYRALGVPPPAQDAMWLVYEYTGLASLQAYCESPPAVRRSKLPPKRGFLGAIVEPPPIPPFQERAKYVKLIIRQIIEAVATLHENGLVHRSIGRGSIIMGTTNQDKRDAVSVYATTATANLHVKLGDFGFSGRYEESTQNEEFVVRARNFGLKGIRKGDNTVATANFAMAEDLHAAGIVVLNLLLTALAEVPVAAPPSSNSASVFAGATYTMPATDEDTLQRLVTDIFDKDLRVQFRDYIAAEDEIWTDLVALLDDKDGAGWTVLETLLLAREKVVANQDSYQLLTIRGLLSNPFFK